MSRFRVIQVNDSICGSIVIQWTVYKTLRSLAKLALNSFWGKGAQRDNLRQIDYIYDPAGMETSRRVRIWSMRYIYHLYLLYSIMHINV